MGEDSPTNWTPQIARAVVLWRRLYDDLKQYTGGPLHVQLDDCNLYYDEIVPDYRMPAHGGRPASDDGYPPEVHVVCDELGALLTAMSIPERFATMAYADGFLEPPGLPDGGLPPGEVDERVVGAYRSGPLVELTHVPTGMRTFGRDGQSEQENRELATRAMRMRLYLESQEAT